MNWRRGKKNSPPGTGGVARRAGVVVESKWFSVISMNEWGGELFDPSTTPALRATPPVPGGEFFLPLLHFIHTVSGLIHVPFVEAGALTGDEPGVLDDAAKLGVICAISSTGGTDDIFFDHDAAHVV